MSFKVTVIYTRFKKKTNKIKQIFCVIEKKTERNLDTKLRVVTAGLILNYSFDFELPKLLNS